MIQIRLLVLIVVDPEVLYYKIQSTVRRICRITHFYFFWLHSFQYIVVNLDYYRPQTKFAKVMFLLMSVCPWGVVSQHALQQVLGGSIPACLAGFQAHTQGGVEGSVHGGLQAHTQGGSWGVWPGWSAPRGVPAPGGAYPRGICSQGVPAWGVCSQGGVETPRDGYCCGQYASYWNAFLLYIEWNAIRPGGPVNDLSILTWNLGSTMFADLEFWWASDGIGSRGGWV